MTRRGLRPAWPLVLTLAASALGLTAGEPASPEQQLARQILDATGVQGGLIVHLGCGDGRLTAALRASESFLVHGLDADPANVAAARAHIQSLGLYGPVSVDRLIGSVAPQDGSAGASPSQRLSRSFALPYADNLVNLLVSDNLGSIPMDEVMRVLVPNGVAYIKSGQGWTKTVKPRPSTIDEWTHYLHDASNNAVAHDAVVGPPAHMQWVGGPRWARHHDHMASLSALVSANGRIFYIQDEGPAASILLPSRWALIARDAFNGVILWRRPILVWNTRLWPLKSGPGQIPRRLVAVGDRVYVTLGLDAPLSALDAATGETVRTYDTTAATEEVIESGGVLFLLVAKPPIRWNEYRPQFTYVWDNTARANREWAWDQAPRRIVAVRAATGEVLWQKEASVAPLTLAADPERVVFHDGDKVVCLNRANGQERWASPPVARRPVLAVSFGPTLVLDKDVVLFSGGDRKMSALSAETGKSLWTAKHPPSGHASPEDLLVINGLVWAGAIANGNDSGVLTGRDPRTGEVKSEFAPDVSTYWFHHRCYRSKATDRYYLSSRTGIEFIDLAAKHWTPNHWVRGGCIYGIMPANGLVYAPSSACACYLESKLNGFNALAPESATSKVPRDVPDEGRLEKGPAFSETGDPQSAGESPADWPTYRHDPMRSGSTKAPVPSDLRRAWQADLGGKLSSVTVSADRLFVASVDAHTVHALDAASGKKLWSYTAGGEFDSPPTLHQGRVLFGSADGWVYCLRAADGQLAWRFRAAPDGRRVVAYEQLESAWPVSGSVLVQNGTVYCVAGRSMFLDGGLRLPQLDPKTGRKLAETLLDDRDPVSGKNLQTQVKGLDMPVALPDILSSDGQAIYMRSQRFDFKGQREQIAPTPVAEQTGEGVHLFSRSGFLDDTWFSRSFWMFGKGVSSGWGGWFRPGRLAPSGRLVVFDEATACGFARRPEYLCNSSVEGYYLYAANREVQRDGIRRVLAVNRKIDASSRKGNSSAADWGARTGRPLTDLSATGFKWAEGKPPFLAHAMVLAGKTLFVAGPPYVADEEQAFRHPDDPAVKAKLDEQAAALEGRKGAQLWAFSLADGAKLAACEIGSMPAFDGMAAAKGRLYLATVDGKVICFSGQGEPLPPAPAANLAPIDTAVAKPAAAAKSADKDFARLASAHATHSALGYRVAADDAGAGLALKRLQTPLKGNITFRFKLRADAGDEPELPMKNGFLAFGDGPDEDHLVQCGLRFLMKTAVIVQGPFNGGKTASAKIPMRETDLHEIAVAVDLASGRVTMKVGTHTVSATLERRLESISYVGYCVLNAITDFSPVETASK